MSETLELHPKRGVGRPRKCVDKGPLPRSAAELIDWVVNADDWAAMMRIVKRRAIQGSMTHIKYLMVFRFGKPVQMIDLTEHIDKSMAAETLRAMPREAALQQIASAAAHLEELRRQVAGEPALELTAGEFGGDDLPQDVVVGDDDNDADSVSGLESTDTG